MDAMINGMRTKAVLGKTAMGVNSGLRGRAAASMDKSQLSKGVMVKP